MEFSFFHLMPWPYIKEPPKGWPVSNRSFLPQSGYESYKTYLEEMVMAEECGFDWIGFNEHHMSPYGLMSNPNLIAAALAYRTSKAKIAVMGNLLPLLNPLRVAEEYAMLDVMSGGRLIAGFIRGIPHEYIAYNIPPDESWERFEEGWRLIVKAWTEPEPFAWEGKYYQYRAVSIWPKPMQKPYPPILMSGGSKQSARFAAKQRAKIGIVQLTTLEEAKENIQTYIDTARDEGWEPTPDYFLAGLHACIAETDEKAKQLLDEGEKYFYTVLSGAQRNAQDLVIQRTRYYSDEESRLKREQRNERKSRLSGASIENRIAAHTVLCGSPDTVVEQIQYLKDYLGIGAMNVNFKIGTIPHEEVVKGLQLFKKDVLPKVRDL